eukprot:231542_1
MGTCSSIKSIKTTCQLCNNKTLHCCKHKCFHKMDRLNIQNALKTSLDHINMQWSTDIIMLYLPTYILININNYYNKSIYYHYYTYCHESALLLYIEKQPPCSKWLESSELTCSYILSSPQRICFKFLGGLCVLRISILGAVGVGKTSLCVRYLANEYLQKKDSLLSIEPKYFQTSMNVNGLSLTVDVLDTKIQYYQSEWSTELDFIRNSKVIFLLFAVNDLNSFDKMIEYYDKILSIKIDNNGESICDYALIVVGTKCDLKNRNKEKYIMNEQRAIIQAHKWNVPFIEISAKDNINIQFLFNIAIYEYWVQSRYRKH